MMGVCGILTSCVSNKKLTARSQYFQELNDSILQRASIEYEPVFSKGRHPINCGDHFK